MYVIRYNDLQLSLMDQVENLVWWHIYSILSVNISQDPMQWLIVWIHTCESVKTASKLKYDYNGNDNLSIVTI